MLKQFGSIVSDALTAEPVLDDWTTLQLSRLELLQEQYDRARAAAHMGSRFNVTTATMQYLEAEMEAVRNRLGGPLRVAALFQREEYERVTNVDLCQSSP